MSPNLRYSSPAPVSVYEGEITDSPCFHLSGSPQPELKLLVGGTEVDEDHYRYTSGCMKIGPIRRGDNTSFTIVARNCLSNEVSLHFEIQVKTSGVCVCVCVCLPVCMCVLSVCVCMCVLSVCVCVCVCCLCVCMCVLSVCLSVCLSMYLTSYNLVSHSQAHDFPPVGLTSRKSNPNVPQMANKLHGFHHNSNNRLHTALCSVRHSHTPTNLLPSKLNLTTVQQHLLQHDHFPSQESKSQRLWLISDYRSKLCGSCPNSIHNPRSHSPFNLLNKLELIKLY